MNIEDYKMFYLELLNESVTTYLVALKFVYNKKKTCSKCSMKVV